MSKLKVYAGGKMSGLKFTEMYNWRLELKEKLGEHFHVINPVDYYNFELDPTTYTDGEVKDFDLCAVKLSDIFVANLTYPDSIGTAMEMIMAHDVWKIPVIAFGGELKQVHPWMRCCITKYCASLDDAVSYIKDFYLPIL